MPNPPSPQDPQPADSQLSAILESFGEGFCAFDRDWRITACNEAAELHAGILRADAIGRSYWDVVPGAVGAPLEKLLRRAMDDGRSVEVEIASVMRDGVVIALRIFRYRGGLAISFRDVTESHDAALAERQHAVRLDLALAVAGLGDWSWDIASDLVTFSSRAAAIFGLVPGPALTWSDIQALINVADSEAANAAVMGALQTRGGYEVEFRVRPPGQRAELWVRSRGQVQCDASGGPMGVIGVVSDISAAKAAEAALKESEARQRLMINELNHRVKNTLATVQSLAVQTARLSATKQEFKDKFLARLLALNAAHSRLTQTSWDFTPLSAVVADQLGLHGEGGRLTAEGPDIRVAPKVALSLSLALHELATNAVKYGALSGDTGHVALRWAVREAAPGECAGTGEAGEPCRQVVDLEWRETDGPPVTPPAARGFGSRLLETVGRELGGRARLAFEPDGLRWGVVFPRGE